MLKSQLFEKAVHIFTKDVFFFTFQLKLLLSLDVRTVKLTDDLKHRKQTSQETIKQ